MEKEITFELDNDQRVIIKQNGKEVGHIFSPASSGSNTLNGVQICGFSEAYDLCGCGIYKGKKDIQLLFDDPNIKSDKTPKNSISDIGCVRCYMKKCICEEQDSPFEVKRERDLKDRIKIIPLPRGKQ